MKYETGPEISLKDVTFSLQKVHRKCEYHTTLDNDEDVWIAVKEENPRKNISLQNIIDNAPAEWVDVDSKTGEKRLKEGIAIDYDFVKESNKSKRTLELSVIGVESSTLSPTRKTDIQSRLDTTFSNKEKNGDVVLKDAKLTRTDIVTPKTKKNNG